MVKKEESTTYFDLVDIWHIFIWHIIPIIAAAVLAVSVVYFYAHFFRTPKYKSTATVYILKQEREGDYAYTQSDFSLALNVVNDCVYMLRSSEVLDDVISELNLDMSVSGLSNCITTRNPDGTRILEVSVETSSPELSKRIVDAVCRIGAEKISATMSINQINIYSWGRVPRAPSNAIGIVRYILIGVCAGVAVYFAYFLAFIFDDKIKNEEDVEKYLNLTVLSVIPNASDASDKQYKRSGRYRSYGKYQQYKYRYSSYGQYGRPAAKEKGKKEEKKEEDRGQTDE